MDALQYTKDLVAFDSVSRNSNVDVTNYVERQLKRLGFDIERLEYDDADGVRKACVLGKKGPGSGGMAYFGHTDVVPADDWHTDEFGPFEPTVKEDRLYGRGSCDMKGSVACMLAAAEQRGDGALTSPLYIVCTADEEVGYGGARNVAERSEMFKEMVADGTRGVIGEPTMLEVVYAHKGTYGFRAVSKGRAAHSSTSEGLNANLAMIPFLSEMKRIHDVAESNLDWQNQEFDPPTISWNIGVNDFTTAINVKAPQCVCTVYFRPMPGLSGHDLLTEAESAAKRCGVEFIVERCSDPLYVSPDSDFVQETLQLAGKDTPKTVAYGTDGGVLTALEKLVVLGPGDIAQAHTWDEWIVLEQLEKGQALYERLIQNWCMG